jgi:subtilase family serine protease
MEAWLSSLTFLISARSLRRLKKGALSGGLVFGSLALISGPLSAEGIRVGLSPLVAKSTLLGPTDPNQQVSVVLTLPLSDPQGAADFIQHLSAPGDPLYHRYLTPQQFAERFGGSTADYAAVKEWVLANGLTVSQESTARINLTVRGSVAQVQALFQTQINRYRSPDGAEFYSAAIKPTIPTAISARVSSVVGLTGSKQIAPLVKIGRTLRATMPDGVAESGDAKAGQGGTGPGGSYFAADLRTAYSVPDFGSFDKKTIVGVFEQGGFDASDVSEYLTKNKLAQPKITPVSVDGSPTVVSEPLVELEAVLDIDMIIGINPSVYEVRVYEDSLDSFQVALLDALTQIGNEDLVQILSISYGQDEYLQGQDAITAESDALEELASEGITVLASSGDNGAYGDLSGGIYNVSDPASQPYVTGVGGTTLFTGPRQEYVGEHIWNDLNINLGASGGGISSVWPIPSWQVGTNAVPNGGSGTMRNVPDVAALGDPLTGVGIYSEINGGWVEIGGTSVAAPIWASYLSVVNATCKFAGLDALGYFNQVLYNVGMALDDEAVPYAFLYDIETGSNGSNVLYPGYPGYTAGYAYDDCKGNGSLWGVNFLPGVIMSGLQFDYGISDIQAVWAVPKATSALLQWDEAVGATAYFVSLWHYGPAGSYVPYVTTSYLTRNTSLEVTGLTPNDDSYYAYVLAVNKQGFSYNSVYFTTK